MPEYAGHKKNEVIHGMLRAVIEMEILSLFLVLSILVFEKQFAGLENIKIMGSE